MPLRRALLVALSLLLAGGGCGSSSTTPAADGDAADVGADGLEEGDAPDGGEVDGSADADADVPGEADAADADADAPADVVPPEDALYAAPDGAGDACTRAAPCDLPTARDVVRRRTPAMTEDLVVRLRGGRYELVAPLELDGLQDSGRGGHWVVWEAEPGEAPVLSGGRRIVGWEPFDASRNLWRAPVPAGLSTRQLYVNGERALRARGPWQPAGFTETATGYTAPDGTMAAWRNPTDVEVVSLRYWKAFRCGVSSIVGADVVIDEPCWSLAQSHAGFDMGLPSWIENAFELLGRPGEWYLDRSEGFLYWIPRPGEDPATAEVIAPALETLLVGRGTAAEPLHHVRIEGLGFEHATWLGPEGPQGYPSLQAGWFLVEPVGSWAAARTPGHVHFEYAQGLVLRRNRFQRLGACGLVLARGSRRNEVVGNVFRDLSGGAVQLGDIDLPHPTDPRDAVEDNLFGNNLVQGTGREYFDAAAVFVGYTAGTTIRHNELRDASYTGISVGWGWSAAETVARRNQVLENRVTRVMRRLEDGGLIYTLSAQPESVIRGNFFSSQLHPYGAIYLDQGTNFYTITDNVVAGVPYWVMLQPVVPPFASNNLVQFNFADTSSVYCCATDGCCTDAGRGNTLADNTVFAPGAWPAEARPILDAAGLEPEFADLRPVETRVEAEDYDWGGEGVGFHELSPGNAGLAYRADGVDVYPDWTSSNEHVVGWTETGEWLRYLVDAAADGSYLFRFAAATIDDRCAIQVHVDGVDAGMVGLPDTGSYQTFAVVELPGVALTRGPHLVTLTFAGGFNFDWFSWR
jgi:hypothetical protein